MKKVRFFLGGGGVSRCAVRRCPRHLPPPPPAPQTVDIMIGETSMRPYPEAYESKADAMSWRT